MRLSRSLIVAIVTTLGACASPPTSVDEERSPAPSGPKPSSPDSDDHPASSDPTSTACSEHQADFDALVAKLGAAIAKDRIPGAGIAVVCNGERIFAAGVGKSKKGGAEPVTGNTRFQIASITKTLTATVALRLSERGALPLDHPVRDQVTFLDGQSPYARPFTWLELLSHTAGFPTGFDDDNLDLEPRIRAHAEDLLWSPPGAVFNYSNEGYAVAGLGLQIAAKMPFAALVEKEVFAPAQMTGATMDAARVEKEGNFAAGLTEDGETVMPTDGYLASTYYGPMGGAWASAGELAKLARELVRGGGALLSKESIATMTKARTPAFPGSSYGLGLEIAERGGLVTWSHSGGVSGYGANLVMVPSKGFAIVTLLNGETGFPELESDALQAFAGSPLPRAEPAPPSANEEEEIVGTYKSVSLGTVTVRKANGGLEIILGKAGKTTALESEGVRDTYFFEAPDGYPDVAQFWRTEPNQQGAVRFLVAGTGVGERM